MITVELEIKALGCTTSSYASAQRETSLRPPLQKKN